MIYNAYPIFQKGRILKVEMLEALKNTPSEYITTLYHDYPNGIINGFELIIDRSTILVQPGILKCRNQILTMVQEVKIDYFATDDMTALTILPMDTQETADMIQNTAKVELKKVSALQEGDIELMRFKLKQGAYLRKDYQSFEDLITEYNTINPIYQTISLNGGKSCSAPMIRLFCDYLQKAQSIHPLDQLFCMQALQNNGIVDRKVVCYYIEQRLETALDRDNVQEIHDKLNRIVRVIQSGNGHVKGKQHNQRRLIVD